MKNYTEAQQVLNDMQPILDSCAGKKSYIDGIAIVLNSSIIARSEVSERDFDSSVVPSLLNNLSETTQDTFGEDTNLQYVFVGFKNQNTDTIFRAWTVVFPYKNYQLICSGKTETDRHLQLHQATVLTYVEQLLPLIEAHDRLTN